MGRQRKFSTEKKSKLQVFKSILTVFLTSVATFILLMVVTVSFIFYGPFHSWRDIWITTAMGTFTHQYLATAFFSPKTIEEVMENNTVVNPDGEVNTSLIATHSKGYTQNRQLIKIDQNGYKGYLMIVDDPSRVYLASSEKIGTNGQKLIDIVKKENAIGGINASGFMDQGGHGNGGHPTGIVVSDGKILYDDTASNHTSHTIAGFNKDNIFITGKYTTEQVKSLNLRDCVEFTPILVLNGKASVTMGNAGGLNPRTAIGQREDGAVLMLVIDGRDPINSIGCNFEEVMKIMQKYGAINACALDGGSSSTLVYEKTLKNKPCGPSGARYLPNAWVFK